MSLLKIFADENIGKVVSGWWLVVRDEREIHIKLVGGRLDFHFVQVPTVRLDHSLASKTTTLAFFSCPLAAASPFCHPERRAAGSKSKDPAQVFRHPLERALKRRPVTPRLSYSSKLTLADEMIFSQRVESESFG